MALSFASSGAIAATPSGGSLSPSIRIDPSAIYDSLTVTEWLVRFIEPSTGEPKLGIRVFEKAVGGLICRETAMIRSTTIPHYDCFARLDISDGVARNLYRSFRTDEWVASYSEVTNGSRRDDVRIREKSDHDVICQSVTTASAGTGTRYTCFRGLHAMD